MFSYSKVVGHGMNAQEVSDTVIDFPFNLCVWFIWIEGLCAWVLLGQVKGINDNWLILHPSMH